jgi:hypothetical protein
VDTSCDKSSKGVKRGKTPIGRLDELEEGQHPFREKEPLQPFPDGINPGNRSAKCGVGGHQGSFISCQ